MPSTLANARQSHLVPELDKVGPRRAAAAGMHPMNGSTFALGEVIWEVLVKGHGSVKETAYQMGDTDRSLLRRRVLDGTLELRDLFTADPKALAAFGEFLIDQYGDSKKTKQQIAREKLPELLAAFVDAFSEGK